MTTHEHGQPEFVDDDEPVEKIRAAFRQSERAVTTKRPRDVNSLAAAIVADATEPPDTAAAWLVTVPSDSPPVAVHDLGLSTSSDPHIRIDSTSSLTFV